MIGGLFTVLAGHLVETVKLKAYAAALFAAAALGLLFAAVFGLVALRHWLMVAYGLTYPELWIALAFLVVALGLTGGGLYMQKRKPKTHPAADLALLAAPPTLKLAARNFNARTVGVGVVLVAGVLIGRRLAAARRTTP